MTSQACSLVSTRACKAFLPERLGIAVIKKYPQSGMRRPQQENKDTSPCGPDWRDSQPQAGLESEYHLGPRPLADRSPRGQTFLLTFRRSRARSWRLRGL